MFWYLLNIVIIILTWNYRVDLNYVSLQDGETEEEAYQRIRTKRTCIAGTLGWIILSGLRHESIGADTSAYADNYVSAGMTDWADAFYGFVTVYIDKIGKDPGYVIFEKIFYTISSDYNFYLTGIAILFTVPLGIWIYKYSQNACLSFVLYSVLFYAFFAITGHRQTIATAMVVLMGDKLIQERKLWKFLVLCLVAATIHKSALVFFSFYFVSQLPINKKMLTVWCGAIVCSFGLANQLKSFIISFGLYEEYAANYEGGGTYVFTSMLAAIFLFSLYAYKFDLNLEKNKIFYNALYMAMFFTPLTFLNPSAMRIVQYFSIYLMLVLPIMIDSCFVNNNRRITYGCCIGVLIALLIMHQPVYYFFWEL